MGVGWGGGGVGGDYYCRGEFLQGVGCVMECAGYSALSLDPS